MANIFGINVKGSSINLLNSCANNLYVLHRVQELRAVKQNPLTRYAMGNESASSKPYMHTLKVDLPEPDAIISLKPIDNIAKVGIMKLYRTTAWEIYLVSSLDANDWLSGSNAIARSRIRVKTYLRNIATPRAGGYGISFFNSGTVINSDTEFLYPITVANTPKLSSIVENASDLAVVFSVHDAAIQQFGGNRPWALLNATNGVKWSGGKVLPTLMGFGANWYNNTDTAWGYFNITENKAETWGNLKAAYGLASRWHDAIVADAVTRGSVMLARP